MDSVRQQYKLINNLKFVYLYFFFISSLLCKRNHGLLKTTMRPIILGRRHVNMHIVLQ